MAGVSLGVSRLLLANDLGLEEKKRFLNRVGKLVLIDWSTAAKKDDKETNKV